MEDYKEKVAQLKEEIENEPIKSEKRVSKVVSGPVKQKKKSELRKLTDIFIAEDMSKVKSYIVSDVIIPTIKDAIEDVVHLLLRGEVNRGGKRNSPVSKVSYRAFYDRQRDSRDRDDPRPRSVYDYGEFTLNSRGEAEEVLSQMDDIISMYGTVSVADYYEMLGVTGNYTDNKYGWSNIRNATVVRVRDGYTIKLPRAVPLV